MNYLNKYSDGFLINRRLNKVVICHSKRSVCRWFMGFLLNFSLIDGSWLNIYLVNR